MKIRVTIEYDTDSEDLEYERKAWLEEDVNVADIIEAEAGTVTFEEVGA